MSVIQNAVADFQSKLANDLKSVDVPEWKTRIYFRPSWSLKQQSEVNRLAFEGKRDEAMVEALIIRSLDENGDRVFKKSDKTELMTKVDPEVISRITIEMNREVELDEEDAVKNS